MTLDYFDQGSCNFLLELGCKCCCLTEKYLFESNDGIFHKTDNGHNKKIPSPENVLRCSESYI